MEMWWKMHFKLVLTADSCNFSARLLMTAQEDEALTGEKKKRIRFHYFILKESRPTTLDLAEAVCAKK